MERTDNKNPIKLRVNQAEMPEKEAKNSSSSFRIKVTDNKIPNRGFLWYIFFSLVFLASSAIIIYIGDWPLLFFVIVFAGVTLWRGHAGKEMDFEIDQNEVSIDEKKFPFEQIESWYFSRVGDDVTINFQLVKKYLPRLSFILNESKDLKQTRKALGSRVPEIEPKEEGFIDFFIRKLKI
ncbi:hypothetical protein C4544_00280 [candidate division WS5 bacterium]|uniref:Uncharacterized protein n=1 Tax=candidate division WS5 bacterium TaxID=2093353 RepID=A0A419DGM2_9BACT|nr:MAG: hypothetical protein C4544_00280 [candidate division WS5 bacterium]